MATTFVFGIFAGLMVLGVPVAAAMIAAAIAVLYFIMDMPLLAAPTFITSGVSSFELLAVPFFIFAAELMNVGGITRRLFAACLMITGRVPGALAQVNVASAAVFAGISGSALADLAGLGRVQIKAMVENGYRLEFSTALTVASCMLSALIPPSIAMVIYAISAQQSVGKMLLAGLLPGIFLAIVLSLYVLYLKFTGKEKMGDVVLPAWSERLRVIAGAAPALLSPLLILSGIGFGIFTPTEAGVAACVYSLFIAVFVYREVDFPMLMSSLVRTVRSSALIMIIIGAANLMSWIITVDQGAVAITQWLVTFEAPVWLKLLVINLVLLLLGTIMEHIPALLIVTPILLPGIIRMGVDPIHFGVMLNFNLLLGMITPPVGMGLFIASNVTGMKLEAVTRAIMPFFVPLLIALAVMTYVPALSTLVPNLVFN